MTQSSNPLSVMPEALTSYPPEVQAYVDKINAYIAAQRALGYEAKMTNIYARPGATSPYQDLMDAGVAPESLVEVGRAFTTNKGNPAKARGNASGVVYNVPGASYRLVNEKGKDSIAVEGSGLSGLDAAYQSALQLSDAGGKKADWGLEVKYPGSEQWVRLANDDPAKSMLGKIADIALPLAGALLLPGVGGIAGALGSVGAGAAGAALGSTASGIAQGRSVGDIAKGALISGGLSYLGGSLAKGLGGVGSGGTSTAAGGAASTASGGVANAVGGLADDLVVNGIRTGANIGGGLAAGAGGALAGGLASGSASGDIVVNGQPTTSAVPGALPGAIGGALPTDLVVNGTVPSTNAGTTGGAVAGGVVKDIVNDPTKAGDTANSSDSFDWSKLPGYAQLAGLIAGGIDSLFGSGGSGNATVPAGLGGGGLNGVFSTSLPSNPIIPGTGGLNAGQLGPRVMPQQDWNKYAFGPEQSFFKQVPQMARGGSFKGKGHSSEPLAVRGPGSGRDDTVPSLLSDGEYVMDAETVSLLGDGSNTEGAKRLDDFRVQVRQHKGRKLAKGRISPDALPVARYISGGLA